MNLMRDNTRLGGSELAQSELIVNGLKLLRVLSSDRDYATMITEHYEMCAHNVLSLLESHFNNRVILDEGRETIQNLSRY